MEDNILYNLILLIFDRGRPRERRRLPDVGRLRPSRQDRHKAAPGPLSGHLPQGPEQLWPVGRCVRPAVETGCAFLPVTNIGLLDIE